MSVAASLPSGYSGVLIWGSIGIVVVMGLGFVLMWFRRKYHPSNMADDAGATFSMQSIEDMRDKGLISDEEFRRLRVGALGLAPPTVDDNDNSALSRPGDVDDGLTEELQEPDSGNEPQDYKENK